MSTLFHSLPSFAPDYSGFFSALHGLDGLLVLHDPSGCLGNYISCDEPRWYHDPRTVFTSLLKEMEAVTGDDSALVEKVVHAAEIFHPPFICILSTPVPSLIGFDPHAAALTIQEQTGIPSFGVETTGFPTYQEGITHALALLNEHFMAPAPEKREKTVNVLGMTPLDYFINGEQEKLTALLDGLGWQVNAFVGGGDSLADIENARAASCNIVMSMAALPLAQKMQREDGIPYWVGPPCGDTGIQYLAAFLNGEELPAPAEPKCDGAKVLVVAEQAIANALRRQLQADEGCGEVTVASFFGLEESRTQPGDRLLKGERELKWLIADGGFDIVVGDNLFQQFCTPEQRFIPLPHPAVSSRLYWKNTRSFIGGSHLL